MKKRILYLAILVICLSLITGGTLAYYTGSDTARNVITSGAVDVTILSRQMVGGEPAPYPQQPISIMPGRTVSKIVTVQSPEQPAWIRLRFTLTVLDAQGQAMEISPEELETVFQILPDAENWTFRDGWWYYNAAVGQGDETLPLFEQIVFSGPNMGNQYQRCSLVVDLTAQGVQQANNGTSALEAAGWPES